MNRFVIAVTRIDDLSQPFAFQAFKVSQDLDANDVTVPINTVFFMFARSKARTYEEFKNSLMTIQIGNHVSLDSSIGFDYEDDGKRYWIGKEVSFEGTKFFFNKHTNVFVPVHLLGDNYELIDM